MLEIEIMQFHFPMERTCPLARVEEHKDHDKFVKVNVRCARLNYIQEYVFRVYEYFYYQIVGALSDSNPYLKLRAEANDIFKTLLRQAKEEASRAALGLSSSGNESSDKRLDQQEDHNLGGIIDPTVVHPYWTILNADIFSDLQ